MDGWTRARIGDVASVFNGRTPPKPEQRSAGHPVLKIKDVNQFGQHKGSFNSFVSLDFANKYPTKHAQIDDTLILNAAHNSDYVASKIYRVEPSAVGALTTGEWLIVRPDPKILDARFAHHWLASETGKRTLRELVNGIHLYPKDVSRASIAFPDLSEQNRIAQMLDRSATLNSKRRESIAQLDELAQSMFLDMFGDPVRNDFGWHKVHVGDFIGGFESGKNVIAEDGGGNFESLYRVLKVSAVTELIFRPDESKAAPESYNPPPKHLVKAGDLLFSRANTSELIGATAYVGETPRNLLLPDKIWRFVWRESIPIEPLYVLKLFQNAKFRHEITKRSTGTSSSMKNISQEKVLSIPVGHPPLELQQEFARRIEAVERLKASHRAHLAELDGLFASIQHRAFQGEL